MVACEMQPLNNLRTLNFLRTGCGLDEAAVRVWYHHWIADGFAMIERYLTTELRTGRYSFGDMVTLADCCLVPQVFNAKRFECDLRPTRTSWAFSNIAAARIRAVSASAQPERHSARGAGA
jgi:glutathione S-transferase